MANLHLTHPASTTAPALILGGTDPPDSDNPRFILSDDLFDGVEDDSVTMVFGKSDDEAGINCSAGEREIALILGSAIHAALAGPREDDPELSLNDPAKDGDVGICDPGLTIRFKDVPDYDADDPRNGGSNSVEPEYRSGRLPSEGCGANGPGPDLPRDCLVPDFSCGQMLMTGDFAGFDDDITIIIRPEDAPYYTGAELVEREDGSTDLMLWFQKTEADGTSGTWSGTIRLLGVSGLALWDDGHERTAAA